MNSTVLLCAHYLNKNEVFIYVFIFFLLKKKRVIIRGQSHLNFVNSSGAWTSDIIILQIARRLESPIINEAWLAGDVLPSPARLFLIKKCYFLIKTAGWVTVNPNKHFP
jgi:hypothetical protein